MPAKDARPKIQLSADETDRLVKYLDDRIQEAVEFRGSSEWDTLHTDFWRMYRSDPAQKVRSWPWQGASNLYIPLVKVAVNTTLAQEYEAMLSVEPKVIGTEGSDQELADDLSNYYFGYYYKKELPLPIFGTDWFLDNCIDGTSAMKPRQNTDFIVRRSEKMVDVPVYENVDSVGMDGIPIKEQRLTRTDYEWQEKAWIERVDQTTAEVADLHRIYMSPETGSGKLGGSAFYADSCPWYYQESWLTWEELVMRERSIGYNLRLKDGRDLKAFMQEPEPTEKEKREAEREGTKAGGKIDKLKVLEFYLPWQLPVRYQKIDDGDTEDVNQTSKTEDGYLEEIVVTYAAEANHVLLVRPLSRVCPDGKRPHVSMHYRRTPRFIYGIGLPSEMRDVQAGINKSSNQMWDYGDLSNMPWGFYSPGAMGSMPELGSLEPGRMYEALDPRGVYFHKFNLDVNYYLATNNILNTWAEKIANISDTMQGRSPSSPNAPRTARGMMAQIQMGQIAFAVLTAVHAESFKEFFRRIHAFKKRWAKPVEAFRILNKETGMWQSRNIDDKAFQYDADFEFNLMPNKTQEQQVNQSLYQITLSGIQQALAAPMLADMIRGLVAEIWSSLGKKNFDYFWPKDKVRNIVMQSQMNRADQAQGNQQEQPNAGLPPNGGPPAPPPTAGPENANLQPMGPLQ
jgi:hypothetical protein